MKLKIGIIDDDYLIVDLMKTFFTQLQQSYEVIFTATLGSEALEILQDIPTLPDLLLLDMKMPGINGIELTQILKEQYPTIHIIIISSHYQDNFLSFMIKHGCAAFLPKGIALNQLIHIIEAVSKHGFYLLPNQVKVLRQQIATATVPPDLSNYGITERELEIVKLIAMQKTAKEIGEILFIAPRTVEGHKNSLFAKTGTKNIAGLIIFAIQKKLIQMDDILML